MVIGSVRKTVIAFISLPLHYSRKQSPSSSELSLLVVATQELLLLNPLTTLFLPLMQSSHLRTSFISYFTSHSPIRHLNIVNICCLFKELKEGGVQFLMHVFKSPYSQEACSTYWQLNKCGDCYPCRSLDIKINEQMYVCTSQNERTYGVRRGFCSCIYFLKFNKYNANSTGLSKGILKSIRNALEVI